MPPALAIDEGWDGDATEDEDVIDFYPTATSSGVTSHVPFDLIVNDEVVTSIPLLMEWLRIRRISVEEFKDRYEAYEANIDRPASRAREL